MKRVVFDSNVVIAAFATRGLCQALFELCLRSHQIVLSAEILGEVEAKLSKKIKIPDALVREVLKNLKDGCVLARPVPVPKEICRDPKDLAILGAAAASGAAFLVTGDADLLAIKRYHETLIVNPRQLYELLRVSP